MTSVTESFSERSRRILSRNRWAFIAVGFAFVSVLLTAVGGLQSGRGLYFWHSVAFTNVADIAAVVAAFAAVASAWMARMTRPSDKGVNETEARLLQIGMEHLAEGKMTSDQFHDLTNTLVRLREADGSLEISRTSLDAAEMAEAVDHAWRDRKAITASEET